MDLYEVTMRTELMRDESYLLPDPGGEVVRDLLDVIDQKNKDIQELAEALKMYVLEYEIWEEAVHQVCGRIPETGLHLALAKELIAKHK